MSLDAELYGPKGPQKLAPQNNPVGQQIDLLSTAFGAAKRND